MYEVRILDTNKKIILLRWSGVITEEEVKEANEALEEAFQTVGQQAYFLVDATSLNIFAPNTKAAIIEQQRRFVPKMIAIASVINKTLVSKQLAETRTTSGNEKETVFTSFDDALNYLKHL